MWVMSLILRLHSLYNICLSLFDLYIDRLAALMLVCCVCSCFTIATSAQLQSRISEAKLEIIEQVSIFDVFTLNEPLFIISIIFIMEKWRIATQVYAIDKPLYFL